MKNSSVKFNTLFGFFFLLFVAWLAGCGYTTRGFLSPEYKTIYIEPVKNQMRVTGETQEYAQFRTVPPLIEDRFTQAVIARFNLDGNLKPSNKTNADLTLKTEITDYVRDTLRYDDQDRVEEYRLRIFYRYELYDSDDELVSKSSLIADTEFAPGGTSGEDQALSPLLEDAARRIVEDIVEMW